MDDSTVMTAGRGSMQYRRSVKELLTTQQRAAPSGD